MSIQMAKMLHVPCDTHAHILDSFKLNGDLVLCTHSFVTVVMDTLSFKFIAVYTAGIRHQRLHHIANHEVLLSARLFSTIKVIHVGLMMLNVRTVSLVLN